MAERLKDIFFTDSTINKFSDAITQYYPEFDKQRFRKLVFIDDWESKELKQRMRHMTYCLYEVLPGNYREALEILKAVAPLVKGFEAMTLPDFVEVYGMEDWEISLPALGHFTKYSSSEFAIRPFLDKDPVKTMTYMNEWAGDKDERVRRFASEGCRPRLPWAMALPKFKKNPDLILPILEKLKNDDSEFVRRSVANNLNDISKDNPDLTLQICRKWYGHSEKTDWVVKHACRGMLKAGNKKALMLFGYGDTNDMQVVDLKVQNKFVTIGDYLKYTFDLIVAGKSQVKVRLEYCIDFMKASRKTSGKIFKITENSYKPGKYNFNKKHSFIDMSTRKHYPGKHGLTIIVNGEEQASLSFEVGKY